MNDEHPSPVERAKQVAARLISFGVPAAFHNDIVAVVGNAIFEAQQEAGQVERRRITAEWLTQMLPGEVITMAAEKVAAQCY